MMSFDCSGGTAFWRIYESSSSCSFAGLSFAVFRSSSTGFPQIVAINFGPCSELCILYSILQQIPSIRSIPTNQYRPVSITQERCMEKRLVVIILFPKRGIV